ncbi:MAG: histidine phosphatase family protein [Chloroflexi bacterium]|nr:MAG: histidine phosphatase family protein [Chloroflexota bacterium]
MSPATTQILLMRHADVENPNRVLYGHLPGFPLSALGRAQAAAAGQSLRDRGIKRIVHSPLDRARETAEIVNAQLAAPVPLIPEPALREAEFGRYLQGVPYWQIPIRRPRWLMHKLRRGTLDGDESIEALGRRVLGVVDRLAREHPGEVSLCVSHADPLQAAWVLLDGRPQTEREMYHKQVGRAAILELDLNDVRVVAVRYLATPTLALL